MILSFNVVAFAGNGGGGGPVPPPPPISTSIELPAEYPEYNQEYYDYYQS